MMPGVKRRLRLLVDWNIRLLFGRDASELGRLGHPVRLTEAKAGGLPADGDLADLSRSPAVVESS
jgi:NADH:ubiquinone reductase (H+-translocating)